MEGLLTLVLKVIYFIGVSTVSAISRYCVYEPEEDVELAEWMEKRKRD